MNISKTLVVIVVAAAGIGVAVALINASRPVTTAEQAISSQNASTLEPDVTTLAQSSMKTKTPAHGLLSSSPSGLPPSDLPLKKTFESLLKLAKTGNAEAASRLAKEANSCAEYRYTLQMADYLTKPTDDFSNSITDERTAELAEEQIDRARRNIARASKLGPLCEGIGDEILDGRVFRYAVLAATLGDWKAGNCVVEGVLMPGNEPLDSDFWDEYRSAAPIIAQNQIEAGDIMMVAQLVDVYDPSPGSVYWQLNLANRQKSLVYALLIARIADEESLPDINSRIEYASRELSDSEIKGATNEAALLYEKYFPGLKQRITFRRTEAVCHPGYL